MNRLLFWQWIKIKNVFYLHWHVILSRMSAGANYYNWRFKRFRCLCISILTSVIKPQWEFLKVGLNSTVESASDCRFRGRKFESQPSLITFVQTDHKIILRSFSPFPWYGRAGVSYWRSTENCWEALISFRWAHTGYFENQYRLSRY